MTSSQIDNAIVSSSIRRHLIWGGATLGLLVGGLGAWAATSEISGAIIAPGVLVVDGNAKKV